MAPHSSALAWKVPWTEEPAGLQSMGSQRVGHDWLTSLSLFTFMHWRRKWQSTPEFLPGESQGWGSLVRAVYGVAQSQTRLKWRSSSSSGGKKNKQTVVLTACEGPGGENIRFEHSATKGVREHSRPDDTSAGFWSRNKSQPGKEVKEVGEDSQQKDWPK